MSEPPRFSPRAPVGAPVRGPVRLAPRTDPRVEPTPQPVNSAARRREQDGRDRRVVGALIIAFVIVIGFAMVVQIRTSSRETDARAVLQQTFERVHTRQREYRTIFGRFATWPELRDRGVGVGPRQRVIGWSADRSHWFLSLKDTVTGVECDRTGELFDEDAAERLPVCRPAR